MDTDVSASTFLLVCWPTVVLLGVFAFVHFLLREGAGSAPQARDGRMGEQQSGFFVTARLVLLGVILLGIVLLIPDAGQVEHRSFFSVAEDSAWGHPFFDWPAAWCSVKIIVLSISGLLILEAMFSLAMHARQEIACVTLLVLSIFPVGLGFFGFYQFVKAVF